MFNVLRKNKKNTITLHEVKDYFCVTDIYNHTSFKKNILEAISYEKESSDGIYDTTNSISSTDFFKNNDQLHYKEVFINNVINKHYQHTINKLGFNSYSILNIWYQQYNKNDTHDWHTHPESCYSNVYFLELPTEEVATEFLNVKTNKAFTIGGLKEGDLLSFPAHVVHRSPKNKTNYRKTVIVFNSSVFR